MIPLVLATRNPHKTREFIALLGSEFLVTDLSGVPNLPVVEETGGTFEENAALKAIAASETIPGLVVADDSGLEVAALGGDPGVFSARYAGENATDQENIQKLLAALQAGEGSDRHAHFRSVLALASGGKVLAFFRGAIAGKIVDRPRGNSGFGYDPIFAPVGLSRTFAEIGDSSKNQRSHRAMAVAALREHFLNSPPKSVGQQEI